MSYIKVTIKDWLPPIILRTIKGSRMSDIKFEGNYKTWEEASSKCTGYDAELILTKVLEASLKVKNGEAVFERDSVLFNRIEYAWPVTAGLMWIAAQSSGRLDVLDFGGALGSSYFQNRAFLQGLSNVHWSVIEQEHYVAKGCKNIQDDTLRFYSSIDSCLAENMPNAVLLSSVLQYLPNPWEVLSNLLSMKIDYVMVDRTPFLNLGESSIIKVQSVPASIYSASYPCWFFEMAHMQNLFKNAGYQEIENFESIDKLSPFATWRGFIFKRVTQK